MHTALKMFAITIAALALAACTQQAQAPASAAATNSPFRPTATIQDLMTAEIDPAADYLWESVATISTPAGVEERMPRTDEEWAAARRQAIILIEATNLLMMEGRHVGTPGKALEESYDPDAPTAEEIEKAIADTRPSFIAYAQGLYEASMGALAAIDARDHIKLQDNGEVIDQACEQCHQTYWYPNVPPRN